LILITTGNTTMSISVLIPLPLARYR